MKKILPILLICLLAGCSSEDNDVLDIYVDISEVRLKVGEKYQLKVNVVGKNKIPLSHLSDNPEIAELNSDNVITANSPGETYVHLALGDIKKHIQVTVYYTLDQYYENFCFGFRVKDTTDLEIYSLNNDIQQINTSLISGIKKNNLWIGKFYNDTKEQKSELIDSDIFKFDFKINLGYGEYENIKINLIYPSQFFETENHQVAVVELRDYNSPHNIKQILFSNGGNIAKYSYINTGYPLYEWFNNSYIFYRRSNDINGYTIFDNTGDILREINTWHDVKNVIPVSYTDYLDICFLWQYDTQLTLLRTFLGQHSYSTNKWTIRIPVIKESNAKYEMNLIDRENDIYKLSLNVIEYSGEKHSHIITVNVETGELISLI